LNHNELDGVVNEQDYRVNLNIKQEELKMRGMTMVSHSLSMDKKNTNSIKLQKKELEIRGRERNESLLWSQ